MRKVHYFYLLVLATLGIGMFLVNIDMPSASAHVKYTVVPKSLRGTYHRYSKKSHKWSRVKFTKYTYKLGKQPKLSGKKLMTGGLYRQLSITKYDSYYVTELSGTDAAQAFYKGITVTKNGRKMHALKEFVSYPGIKHEYTRIWYPSKIK
ncbi:hypothetical protein ACFQ44_09955 [Levilactobacillus lanxiensis]|uniref:Uncharacterized protein n=1 Tax=Levilactobacillus lanxiensis TaxID=2799568 RepID=A0ABW4D5Z0_9LACO|nr:hypothetical protein [Levilactobacillus lanxiensis]